MKPDEKNEVDNAGKSTAPDSAGKLWEAYSARQVKGDAFKKTALAVVFVVFMAMLAVGLWIIAVR